MSPNQNTKKPLCQCPRDAAERPCKNEALDGSLFCANHQNCKPSPANGSEPEYIGDALNKSKAFLETHNCMSYALRGNKVNKELMAQCKDLSNCDVNFEQPGAASGERKAMRNEALRTCPAVEKLTRSDLGGDFIKSKFWGQCPKGMSKVALVADPGSDYHWYRKDKKKGNEEGGWSDKAGSNKVKRVDASGRPIFNPAQINRNYGDGIDYEDFCGFYCVNRTRKVRLKQGGKRRRSQSRRARTRTLQGGRRPTLRRSSNNSPILTRRYRR